MPLAANFECRHRPRFGLFPIGHRILRLGESEGISYLAVLVVLIEAPLGLFLIFLISKDLLSAAAMLVLVVFAAYSSYVYSFTDGEYGCGGGEQWDRVKSGWVVCGSRWRGTACYWVIHDFTCGRLG